MRACFAILGCVLPVLGSGCFLDRGGIVDLGVDGGPARDGGPDTGPIRRDSGPDCVPTGSEVCDDVDDDCDGFVDEDLVPTPCDSNDDDMCFDDAMGCMAGMPLCVDDGESDTEREICDNTDNDCRGDTADGDADPMLGQPCDGDDLGACLEGTFVGCTGGVLECDDTTDDDTDTSCNGSDGDCDGRVDDDATSDCPCPHAISDDGHSYFFCSSDENWADARDICKARGYFLARIDDATENQWIADRLPNGDGYWIGATDDDAYSTEGTFVWYDDAPPRAATPYQNWTSGEPSNSGGNEDCAEIDRDDTSPAGVRGGWNDDDCPATGGQGYVCEAAP